jgi:hypothetical protein
MDGLPHILRILQEMFAFVTRFGLLKKTNSSSALAMGSLLILKPLPRSLFRSIAGASSGI